MSLADIEQAHSYAAHAQVGANYYVLCNGSDFQIFETLSGAASDPILSVQVFDLNNEFHKIEAILGPEALAKNCQVIYDFDLQLAEGLNSTALISRGEYDLIGIEYRVLLGKQDITVQARTMFPDLANLDRQIKELLEIQYTIEQGEVYRNDEGKIVTDLKFGSITKNNAMNLKRFGIEKMCFVSADKFLSSNINSPSLFESEIGFSATEGTRVFPLFGDAVSLVGDMDVDTFVEAEMFLKQGKGEGRLKMLTDYAFNIPNAGRVNFEVEFVGTFCVNLA